MRESLGGLDEMRKRTFRWQGGKSAAMLMPVDRVRAANRKCSASYAGPDGGVYAPAAYMGLSGEGGAQDAVAGPSQSRQGPIDIQTRIVGIIVSPEMVDRRNCWPHT
jgi:hypothetical protein